MTVYITINDIKSLQALCDVWGLIINDKQYRLKPFHFSTNENEKRKENKGRFIGFPPDTPLQNVWDVLYTLNARFIHRSESDPAVIIAEFQSIGDLNHACSLNTHWKNHKINGLPAYLNPKEEKKYKKFLKVEGYDKRYIVKNGQVESRPIDHGKRYQYHTPEGEDSATGANTIRIKDPRPINGSPNALDNSDANNTIRDVAKDNNNSMSVSADTSSTPTEEIFALASSNANASLNNSIHAPANRASATQC
jgi:hypothetical protein